MALDDNPKKKASEHLKNADRLLKAGQLQEALQETEQALALDPRSAYALAYQQRIKSAMEHAPKTTSPQKAEIKKPPKAEVKEAPKIVEQPKKVEAEVQKPQRKLAAIMFTDIVGYTALTQRNESLSLKVLEEHRKQLRPVFAKHEGKEIKTLGDSFLVEFTSVLHAVRCALEIQDTIVQNNSSVPEDQQIQLRIGIHLGDVVYQENDIFGDGVNIASRLHEQADPGGICISQDVYNQIRTRDEFKVEYVGEVELKNVLTPIPLYMVLTKQEQSRRVSDEAIQKVKEETVLEAKNQKLQQYVTRANDFLQQNSYGDAILEVMRLQVLDPQHPELKNLDERVRKGRRSQTSKEIEEKKKVPKENILKMYTEVVQQSFSSGELTADERKTLDGLRNALGITEEEHLTIAQQFQK